MEGCIDFVQLLNADLSTNILSYLDDPADVVRVGSVSRVWRQFGESIISNFAAIFSSVFVISGFLW